MLHNYICMSRWQTCDFVLTVPFPMLIAAHAKLFGASLHATTHHESVPRLKDVEWAGNSRIGHSANKYRDVLCKTENRSDSHSHYK